MRSTIDLMNIKPAPAENPRRGVPAPEFISGTGDSHRWWRQ